ncbi:DsbA family oxidoreductase [uncultured Clostridium sp.]|uniref:DsbA family oxidoreductase n=1 Tax=uncultured Clostridium sp. TaxID=59620 RepID=UPI0028ECD6B6|nr:DsbA family oxidoreductase [uncultured Clostridium sp.]
MKIQIDIWSDYICPFCFIGKKRLQNVINQFNEEHSLEVRYRSFQLDPAAEGSRMDTKRFAQEHGMTVYELEKAREHVIEMAKDVGLDLHFDTFINANTFDSHRLGHYAATKGKDGELTERLMRASLSESLNIADRKVLVSLAGDVGLDGAAEMLKSDAYSDQVIADLKESKSLNITGVPFFVFNNKYTVSGAQSEQVFLNLINKILEEG